MFLWLSRFFFASFTHKNKNRTQSLDNGCFIFNIDDMRYFLFICIGLCCLCHLAFAKIEVTFTPSKECENSIIRLIDKTQQKIDIAVYAINNENIVNALKRAHNRGVKLRILTDRIQAGQKNSRVLELYKYGINVRVNSKHKIEHNKFTIFDDDIVFTGSFNWTVSASEKNSENCLFAVDEPQTVQHYQKRFAQLWLMNTKAKSDVWFKKRQR